jgi:short subunit dehydrogenase-like uncharacterized protein
MAETDSRAFDLVVFGATGFTGRLVAEVLHATGAGLRWALAGRQLDRLAAVRSSLGAPASLPLLEADASDAAAMADLARQARVIVTTVGPYQRHGQALVEACAAAGTDYCDLCGEPLWMAEMIPRLQPVAAASGARIVFSCGFDSIPFDLGVLFLQQAMLDRFGASAIEVRARVRVMKGGFSGGTAASLLATLEAIGGDRGLARTMADPFALTAAQPGFRGPVQPEGESAAFDDWADAWTGPFVMAPINTKNVHRSNALRGHPWGTGFRYSERMLTGAGPSGETRARRLARQHRLQNLMLGLGPTRALAQRFLLPQPGQGPSAEERAKGRYQIDFRGETVAGQRLAATVLGQGDPGYASTSRLIVETARALLEDVPRSVTPGGVWTPASALGLALVRRLQERAGLSFEVADA